MKFSNLMLFTGAAWVSYHLVKNRKTIIQEQRDNIKEMAQDLTYKYKIFEKQAQVQITQIQDIWQ